MLFDCRFGFYPLSKSEIRFPKFEITNLILFEQFRIKRFAAIRADPMAEFMLREIHKVTLDRHPGAAVDANFFAIGTYRYETAD